MQEFAKIAKSFIQYTKPAAHGGLPVSIGVLELHSEKIGHFDMDQNGIIRKANGYFTVLIGLPHRICFALPLESVTAHNRYCS